MKEVTVETIMRVTEIYKVPDDKADEVVIRTKSEEERRVYAKNAKEDLDVDDVVVSGVKVFVRDVPEKKKKSSKKKA